MGVSDSFESSYDQQGMAKSFERHPCTSADADAGSFDWIKGELDEGDKGITGCVYHPTQYKTSPVRDCDSKVCNQTPPPPLPQREPLL